ncbi:hypothetical protein [Mycolicibacterium iranicum]|uniref:Uncharacterized protein n=1 Tax=Mycolicibacterium iranicum TaxID=912594 RepID=A0A178LHH1_MYCIR|nr:hypothetical protein [Mycolicibacterium iranicum]OAN30173.1 hypothetical protein A4X20_09945 [Mycolicibacterium iranicum]
MSSGFDGASPTVYCPYGHINAWNYKFCGECGAPIGVVAFPEDDDVAGADRPERRRGLLIGGAIAAVVAVVGVVALVGVLIGGTSQDEAEAPRPDPFTAATMDPALLVPECTTAPVVQAESVEMTPDGLTVSAAFLSQCPGGNTEAGSGVRITVADGQRDIAAGLFDFSASPVTMKPGQTARRTLVFPAGMYWRTTAMFSGAPQLVFHLGEQSQATPVASTSVSDRLVAREVAKPEHGSVDGVAEAVLGEIRDADYSYVSGSIANRWVPQISSKKSGLEVDGKTLTSADVLRDHLALREKYSGVRLVSSGQWTTFNAPDWWITVVGVPKLGPAEANGWCDSQGLGVDDCFAKFVSSLFGVEGTTVYRK